MQGCKKWMAVPSIGGSLFGCVLAIVLMGCGGESSSSSAAVDATADTGSNTAPSVQIESPLNNQTVTAEQAVDFVGKAYDAQDGPTQLTAVWSSDTDGTLHTGTVNAVGTTAFTAEGLRPDTLGLPVSEISFSNKRA